MALGVARRMPFTRAAVARAARLSAQPTSPGGSSPARTRGRCSAAAQRERELRRAFTLDILGEAVISEPRGRAVSFGPTWTCSEAITPEVQRLAGRSADRQRRPRPDPARQPVDQAVGPRQPVRRRSTPPARSARVGGRLARAVPRRPAAGGVHQRRYGVVREEGPDAAHLPDGPQRAGVPRLDRRRHRHSVLPARRRGAIWSRCAIGPLAAARRSGCGW